MGGNLVTGPVVGHWVAKKINGAFCAEHATAIGLEKDGQVTAGVIYEHWNGRSIVAHIAIDGGRVTSAFIAAIFDYAFNVCGVEKAIAPVGSHNAKCRRLVEHFGFTEECRLSAVQADGDTVFYTLRRSDCRFIGDRYRGKINASTASAS